MKSQKTREYFHGDLNKEVIAIGGRYRLTHEKRMWFKEKEVLYLTGYALFDSTCCGAGGCTYAVVHGAIISWKKKKDKTGDPITYVMPITDQDSQKEIRSIIMQKETINQVVFM